MENILSRLSQIKPETANKLACNYSVNGNIQIIFGLWQCVLPLVDKLVECCDWLSQVDDAALNGILGKFKLLGVNIEWPCHLFCQS